MDAATAPPGPVHPVHPRADTESGGSRDGDGVRLGTVQETLLIPLYGRAVDSRKPDVILRDTRAEEIVTAIDYDFARFDNLPSLTGAVLRTSLFDRWVADFLAATPPARSWRSGPGSTRATSASTTAAPAGSTSTCPT